MGDYVVGEIEVIDKPQCLPRSKPPNCGGNVSKLSNTSNAIRWIERLFFSQERCQHL